MSKLGDEMIAGMKEFITDLKSGKPIKVTEVRREETPDGPLHTREVKYVQRIIPEGTDGSTSQRSPDTD